MRKPGYLAALASSAVPGLDPVAVRAARGLPGNRCEVAFVTDTQRRAWVVRVPTTPAVGAQLDTSVPLLSLISRRLPFQVPSPRGFVGVAEGRAMVYPFLHGRAVVLEQTPPGPGVAAELGRALAALHNVDRAVFEEAGLPAYDSESYRRRHLADLDRAAATGHVPTALLSRWERALEDVSAWRFAPTPVHGDLGGGRVLVSFTDEEDADTASVRAITGWEHAQVADPADDFAGVAEECSPEAFESVLEAYAVARIERPDRHLRLRARLAAELRALRRLLDAVTSGEPLLITRRAAELRALDERTADLPDLVPPPPVEPEPGLRSPIVPARTPGADAGSDTDLDIDPLRVEADSDEHPTHAPSVDDVDDVDAIDDIDDLDDLDDLDARGVGDARDADGPDERDTSQDTQRLLFGDAAEATTVIPADELSRLRGGEVERPAPEGESGESGESGEAGGSTDERADDRPSDDGADVVIDGEAAETTILEVEVERATATDASWYQVIEPIVPPGSEGEPREPSGPSEASGSDEPAPSGTGQPTVVLVEAAPDEPPTDAPPGHVSAGDEPTPEPDPDGHPDRDSNGDHGDDDGDPAPSDADAVKPAGSASSPPGPRRRHRRATRP